MGQDIFKEWRPWTVVGRVKVLADLREFLLMGIEIIWTSCISGMVRLRRVRTKLCKDTDGGDVGRGLWNLLKKS